MKHPTCLVKYTTYITLTHWRQIWPIFTYLFHPLLISPKSTLISRTTIYNKTHEKEKTHVSISQCFVLKAQNVLNGYWSVFFFVSLLHVRVMYYVITFTSEHISHWLAFITRTCKRLHLRYYKLETCCICVTHICFSEVKLKSPQFRYCISDILPYPSEVLYLNVIGERWAGTDKILVSMLIVDPSNSRPKLGMTPRTRKCGDFPRVRLRPSGWKHTRKCVRSILKMKHMYNYKHFCNEVCLK